MSLMNCLQRFSSSARVGSRAYICVVVLLLTLPSALAVQGKTPTGGAPNPLLRDKSPQNTPPIHSRGVVNNK
jgi:hypothetical protein